MASDLYRDVLKEKDNLNKANPRTRSFGGGLTSSDSDYKNYLAGMRPRTKSNNVKPNNTATSDSSKSTKHSSFVDSAARRAKNSTGTGKTTITTDSKQMNFSQMGRNKSESSLDNDTEKKKQYSELSSVPSRKSVDSAFKSDNSINNEHSKSGDIDFTSLKQTQSELTGSVGRLRSMFDKSSETENKAVVQLRVNKSKKERPHSASFDSVESRPKPKVSCNYDRHSVHMSPLQVDSFIAMNGKEDQINDESLKSLIEDDASRSSKIDVDSILAPEEPKKSEESAVIEESTLKSNEIELKKQLEIDRMKRTQEEIQIEQRFNIKRRTLKEKLSDLAGGSESIVSSYIAPDAVPCKSEKIAPPVAAKPDAKQHSSMENQLLAKVVEKRNIDREKEEEEKKLVPSEPTNNTSNESNMETNFFSNDEPNISFAEGINSTDPLYTKEETSTNNTKNIEDNENSTAEQQSNAPISMNVNLNSIKDSEESEIDKYRSAVERFDDFINKQENLFGLDEDDPLKDFPNDFTPEDSSKLFDTEISTEAKQKTSPGDSKESTPAENNPSDLMNSILNHMEKSKGENKDYVSLLRSSSQESDTKSPKLPAEMPLLSPEAPPRLSKLQGRTPPVSASPPPAPKAPPPAPKSPPPAFVDDPTISRADIKPEPQDQQPQRPSSLSISSSSVPNSVSSTISYMPDESESETEESGYYSVNSSDYYNNNNYVNGNASDNYATYQYSSESESVKLLPPPPKSNLKKSKHDKKRKVGFRDNNIEHVVYTYGPVEYDRANADIDPLTSSAEWELEKRVDSMDIFSVDLHKDEKGLGLSIIGLGVGTQKGFEKLGIFVKTLTENGAAQKDGRVQVNDQILEVNGVSLVGVTQYFAAQTLKGANGVVRFLMGREKTKRTQYAPGAPILDNPEMKKHIEEMNKAMAQVEELQNRALDAEHTLEEVKIELLKAEERAHDAESSLVDTRELLKAATESPFINSQRKLKNEIKKGGKRNGDRVDDLQRSLKEVTNRLSTSEENLLELTSKFDDKDKELLEFQQKLETKQEEERKLAEHNQSVIEELEYKSKELETFEVNHAQLKAIQDELTSKHRIEIEQHMENEIALQHELEKEQEDHMTLVNDLQQSIAKLTAENKALLQIQQEDTNDGSSGGGGGGTDVALDQLQTKLEAAEKESFRKDEEIETLNEKVNYLRNLLVKMEKGVGDKELENQTLAENEELKAKLTELESKMLLMAEADKDDEVEVEVDISLNASGVVGEDGDFPNVPMREILSSPPNHIFGVYPPVVHRDSKPLSPKLPQRSLGDNRRKPSWDDDNYDNDLKSVISDDDRNNITETTKPDDIAVSTTNSQTLDLPNPIPKPPRGHFVSDTDNAQVITPDNNVTSATELPEITKTIERSLLDLKLDSSFDPSSTSEPSSDNIKKNNVHLPMFTIPPPPLCTPPVEQATPVANEGKIIVDLDAPSIGTEKTANTEDNDQGQFQLIQEDVDEEKISLDDYSGVQQRRSTDPVVKTERVGGSQEFFDPSSFTASGDGGDGDGKWNRLDEKADLIAEQIALRSPNKRKISNDSASSAEDIIAANDRDESMEIGRTQSIKIDQSYFEAAATATGRQQSIDSHEEVSVLDDSNDNNVKKAGLVKSLSLDFAVPVTPVLDSKMAQDRINVKGNKRKPPTRSGRKQMLDGNDNLQSSQPPKQSSLPRNLHNNVEVHTAISAAKSVPNLFTNQDGGQGHHGKAEKHHKHHKFGFHLPKVFKKSKMAKRGGVSGSSEKIDMSPKNIPKSNSTSAMERPKSAYVMPTQGPPYNETEHDIEFTDSRTRTRTPTPTGGVGSMPELQNELQAKLNQQQQQQRRSATPTDSDVVPIREKVESMSQLRANEADTEEAVVPFHQKEQSMAEDTDTSKNSSVVPSPTPSPNVTANDTSMMTSPDDVMLELNPPPSTSSASSSLFDAPASSSSKQSVASTNEQYNERGIDVAFQNEPADEIAHWTKRPPSGWDIRQVGLWLVEMNLAQYVNSFKSHNVDGQALLRADGNRLKEYGVASQEHRAEIKRRTKEFRHQLGKESLGKTGGKSKLQFWKGKNKPH